MAIRRLGYVAFDVTDLDGWAKLLGPTLGVNLTVDTSGSGEVHLAELDQFKYRLALYPSDKDAPRHIGWIVDEARELDRLTARLTEAGYTVAAATEEECVLRGAREVRWFTDPAGFRVELTLGEANVRSRPERPLAAGAGVTGLGHFVLTSPHVEELRDLYERVLEFKLTDYRAPGLYFYRCNATHHSIALGHANEAAIHHLELEHESIDDVGRAQDRALENGVPISISLGRHMNDKAISFYVENPSGFHIEVGCAGISVDDDWVPFDFGVSDEWGHHHAKTNPFAQSAGA